MEAWKKYSFLFLSGLLLTALLRAQDRPKVGLVLGGGGSKGVAHIPVLKLLDELEFPVDFIAAIIPACRISCSGRFESRAA